MTRQWLRILALWFFGVLAAAQFARASVLAPQIRASLRLTLSQVGWLISLMEIGGAALGLIAGLLLSKVSLRASLLAGLTILSLTIAVQAVASDIPTIFVARGLEGLGYLFVVVAAPTAILGIASDQTRSSALALWSTFVPIGLAFGAGVTGVLLSVGNVQRTIAAWAIVIALAGLAALAIPMPRPTPRRMMLPPRAVWVSSFGFGLYTMFFTALTMLLPSLLIERNSATLGSAALIAALTPLGALPATGAMILWMRQTPLTANRSTTVSVISITSTAPLVFALSQTGTTSPLLYAALALAAVVTSGFVPPITFARLPQLSGGDAPDDPRIAAANGLITQFGATGALLGPPTAGWILGRWGSEGLGLAEIAVLATMGATIVIAERLGLDGASLSPAGDH